MSDQPIEQPIEQTEQEQPIEQTEEEEQEDGALWQSVKNLVNSNNLTVDDDQIEKHKKELQETVNKHKKEIESIKNGYQDKINKLKGRTLFTTGYELFKNQK